MKRITWETKMSVILVETLFISFLAVLFLNVTVYFFSSFAGLPQTNWGLLGRWVSLILHGHIATPSMDTVPEFPYDKAVGVSLHLAVSFVFVLGYLLLCTLPRIRKIPPIISGVIYGFMLIFFPLCIEYPSMGIHVFSHTAPYITLGFMKIFTCHGFFGIGLGLGRYCLEYIRDAHVSTDVV